MNRLVIALLLVPVLLLSGCRSEESDNDPVPRFPEKVSTRVELRESADSIQYRFYRYSEDGEKLLMLETVYRNGSTVVDYFREDGTLRQELEYFSSPEAANAQLKRVSEYAADGSTLTSRKTFRADGTPESFSRLLVDGNTETELYYPDGKHILTRLVEDPSGDMVLKERYRDDGTLERAVRQPSDNETHIVLFREDGATRKSLTIRKSRRGGYSYGYGYGAYSDTLEHFEYQDDGVTLAMRVSYRTYEVEVAYYGRRGNLEETREYANYGRVTVTNYWANGEKRYVQKWSADGYYSGIRMDIENMTLDESEEFDTDGDTIREVDFWDNGNPSEVRYPDGENYYSGKIEHYNEEGILTKEEVRLDYSSYDEEAEKIYTEEEVVRADLPEELTKLKDRPAPPEKSDLPADQD